jgi:hypothetical protein
VGGGEGGGHKNGERGSPWAELTERRLAVVAAPIPTASFGQEAKGEDGGSWLSGKEKGGGGQRAVATGVTPFYSGAAEVGDGPVEAPRGGKGIGGAIGHIVVRTGGNVPHRAVSAKAGEEGAADVCPPPLL